SMPTAWKGLFATLHWKHGHWHHRSMPSAWKVLFATLHWKQWTLACIGHVIRMEGPLRHPPLEAVDTGMYRSMSSAWKVLFATLHWKQWTLACIGACHPHGRSSSPPSTG
ncbi:hypothetical protein NDU88_007252, partial [Pleurodeles waltl]